MTRRQLGLIAIAMGCALSVPAACTLSALAQTADDQTASAEELAHFERAVRPVLIDACGRCHGAKKQESGLRVDARDALLRGGHSGPAFVPGKPADSLLIQVVRHEHETKMPPDGKLTQSQVAALERWVRAGAPWPAAAAAANPVRGGALTDDERRFWSFQPLQPVSLPESTDSQALDPIDRFIAAARSAHGVAPVGQASRRVLLRRATLDMLGLPPTPEQLAEFDADDAPDALARVVDRLLASPRYGERFGRHWLDVVRYADTAGDGADYPVREAYLYRNYVIQAWNADKPFADFVREQVAGDALADEAAAQGRIAPDLYREQVIATGFLAVSKRFGYNINTEFQHLDIADSIEGLGRSLLGLSIGCARCHDHKYDPVNMADYYSLYGILASSQYAFPGGEEHKRPHNLAPLVPPAEQARRQTARQQQLAALDADIQRLARERAAIAAQLPSEPLTVEATLESQTLDQPLQPPFFQAGPNRVLADAQSPFTHLTPRGGRGARLEAGAPNDGIRLERKPGFSAAATPRVYFSVDFRSRSDAAAAPGAHRFYLGQGAIASLAWEASLTADAIHLRHGAEWERLATLEPMRWYNLQLEIDAAAKTYSGRLGQPGEWVEFRDKSLAPGWNGTIDTFFNDGVGRVAGARPSCDLDNLVLQAHPLPDRSMADPLPPDRLTELQTRLAKLDAEAAEAKGRRETAAAEPLFEYAYAVVEGKPINARIQKRGEPDRLGDEAPRRYLEVLGGEPVARPDSHSGRRDLADWIVRTDRPLAWRVIANRLWQWHFGAGMVRTSSDFGTRGDPPTHPELLEHLTTRLINNGGSLKRLQRDLALSFAYRLSSDNSSPIAAANLEIDPANRWLWRFSRRPLDAESIRDGMLELAGDLDRSMPGPHPFPPVDKWTFTIHYPFHAEFDSAHRSVYLMVQRARKHPYLSLFDGADPNLSTSERMMTTTPTQALYLLNASFVHDRSLSLARRLLNEHQTLEARTAWCVAAATGREANPADFAAAREFLSTYGRRSGVPVDSPAAWAAYARALLVSNGCLFVD